MNMYTFNIYLNGKRIDTVSYSTIGADYVKQSLVDHDGYDPDIRVLKTWNTEYVLQGNYGYGFEDIGACSTRKAARIELRDYANQNSGLIASFRMIIRRVQA